MFWFTKDHHQGTTASA